ncbi:MAG: DUF475 domain-containing protein [Candidatus Staskawiczbacteria bacterium]|nr:DUF475 domain-containing protein [Candidatus Staskawiczbacteria bacterium]
MAIGQILIVIMGLCLFEIISSVDNAIINAHVLKTLPEKFKKFFLTWGLLIAVFAVRGVLPFLIVWLANPTFSFSQVTTFVFNPTSDINTYVEKSQALLLLAGGVYLFFVFLGWLFLEEKKYAFLAEEFVHKQSVWFYAASSLFITAVVYFAIKANPILALSAVIGSTAFFITDGFKKNAEEKEKQLLSGNMSAWSKILYLEVLDATFSIDGVIGAFAFTMSIPLIFLGNGLGNGLGAYVVREFTIKGTDIIAKFAYLKNGAMYSIGVLGIIMVLEAFGRDFPFWLAPLNTFVLLAIFMGLSLREIGLAEDRKK